MTFDDVLAQIIALLQREKRVSYRALKRRFALDDEYLEDLKDEIIKAKRLAIDEEGSVLVWTGDAQTVTSQADHLHLYIDASPEYALDEIVHAIREYVEHEMVNLLPALPPSNQPVWERAYFAESIG